MLIGLTRRALQFTMFPVGKVRTVWFGPCSGLQFRVFPEYSLGFALGRRERDEMRLMMKHIRPGDIVYDLGANYGMHTLLMARLVGPEGSVFAFEPQPKVFAQMSENIRLNEFEWVTPVCSAVSDRGGQGTFVLSASAATGHLGTPLEAGISIETIALDDFVFRRGNMRPTFIKIDIEGAEAAALTGARRLLKEFHPTLLIELHTPEQDRQVGRILNDFGYTAIRAKGGEPVKSLTTGWPAPDGIWGTVLASAT